MLTCLQLYPARLVIVLVICLISCCMCSLNYFSLNDSMYKLQTHEKLTQMAIFNICRVDVCTKKSSRILSRKITKDQKKVEMNINIFECFDESSIYIANSWECAGRNVATNQLFSLQFLGFIRVVPFVYFNQYMYHIDRQYWVRIKTRKLRKS